METEKPDQPKEENHQSPSRDTKGKAPVDDITRPNEQSEDTCVICLSAITERAIAVPCNHLTFDFLCLVHWTQERPNCPLCKATITRIQYDWRAPDDFKTYKVPSTEDARSASAPATPSHTPLNRAHGATRAQRPRNRAPNRRFSPYAWGEGPLPPSPDSALARRRLVYERHAYSAHVGANRTSQYRDFTPSAFAADTSLQHRARVFIRRELQVFSFLQTNHSRAEFLLEYVVGMLKKLEIKGANGAMEGLVAEFLGREDARLFLHELEAWLRSPYSRLEDWDRKVQYSDAALVERKGSGAGARSVPVR